MEEFFDILKTKNSLPDGSILLPDVPPSLRGKLAAAMEAGPPAAPGSHHQENEQQLLQERLASNGKASTSSLHSQAQDIAASGSVEAAGVATEAALNDLQSLREAALLLDQQQHTHHHSLALQGSSYPNLGSADYQEVPGPDTSTSISGLGLEVELDDVRFGYHPERQVKLQPFGVTAWCVASRFAVS